jgi:hypothetical protein
MSNTDMAVLERGGAIATAAEIRAQVNLIQEVMAAVMKEGVHYGVIPGTGDKPTLFKAGAEKILSTFRIAIEPVVEDLSTHDEARYRVQARATAQATGVFLGAGVGECSSGEVKYKWRSAVCQEEFDATPEDRKRTEWKRGRNGQPAYQIQQVRTNHQDLANTVLKMAKKRAQMDACLTVTAASDVFTQDIEDMPDELREAVLDTDKPSRPAPAAPQRRSASGSTAAAPQVAADGTTAVKSITPKNGETNGKQWILYIVKFADGREASTLDEAIAKIAMDARDNGEVVKPVLEPGKKEGSFKLVALTVIGNTGE